METRTKPKFKRGRAFAWPKFSPPAPADPRDAAELGANMRRWEREAIARCLHLGQLRQYARIAAYPDECPRKPCLRNRACLGRRRPDWETFDPDAMIPLCMPVDEDYLAEVQQEVRAMIREGSIEGRPPLPPSTPKAPQARVPARKPWRAARVLGRAPSQNRRRRLGSGQEERR